MARGAMRTETWRLWPGSSSMRSKAQSEKCGTRVDASSSRRKNSTGVAARMSLSLRTVTVASMEAPDAMLPAES